MADENSISDPAKNTYGRFKDRLDFGSKALANWKTKAKRCMDYYAGDQIPSDIRQEMIEQKRPPMVFNQIMPIVNSVTGSEMTNQFEPKYRARTIDDQGFNEVLTDTVKYVRQSTDISYEESAMFHDAGVTGIGSINYWQDYSEDLEGKTRGDHVPIFELTWDPTAKKQNLRDKRWVIRHKWTPREWAVARWPKHKDLINSQVADAKGGVQASDSESYYDTNTGVLGFYNKEKDELLVYEYQWVELEPMVFFEDPTTGEETKVTEEEWAEIQAAFREDGEAEPTNVRLDQKVYKRAFFTGEHTLEEGNLPTQQSGFSYKFTTCFKKRVDNRVEWFGLVEPAMDPQKWANMMLSNLFHAVATNPKGAILTETGAMKDPKKARQDWPKPNPIIEFNDGALSGGEVQIVSGSYPQDLERLYQLSTEAVPRSLGFSPIQLGAQSDLRRTSSQTVRLVQQNSEVMLSNLFQSYRAYREDSGRTHLEYLYLFMPEDTIVRVTQPDGTQAPVPFKREWVEDVKYDVIVDDQPATASNLEALWESLQQTQSLELLMNTGAMQPSEVIDIMPFLSDSLRQRMKKNLRDRDTVGQVMGMIQSGDQEGAMEMLQQIAAQSAEQQPGQQPAEEVA